jgi:dipeptidyl aminopeptidase/acylaminoacyl peptidase
MMKIRIKTKSRASLSHARAKAAALGVALTLAYGLTLAADAETPLKAFGRLPTLEEVVISPDGTKLAFVRTNEDHRSLVVILLNKSEVLGSLPVGDTKLRSVEWIDDDNVLVTASSTSRPPLGFSGATREWYELAVFNVSKLKLNPIEFNVPNADTLNAVIGDTTVREVSGHSILYAPGLCVRDQVVPCLFSLSFPDRRTRIIAESPEPDTEWLVDESGNIAARSVYRVDKKLFEISSQNNGHWVGSASGTAAIDVPTMLGFSADGADIIVEFIENGEPIWKPLSRKDNTWGSPLAKGVDFSRVIEDRKSGRIIGGAREVGGNDYVFFDNELQAHWNAVLRAFPDEQVRLVSHSDDFSRMVLAVFGPKHGFVYALYDWYAHRLTILGRGYEEVTAPAKVSAITYAAADGLKIPGFLTLPRGLEEKNLPLVVLPHGGPAAADTLEFDWWAQALAAQGYAVLQPNYRGSALDTKFMEAGYGEWGRKMQTDLSDGVRYLARQGVIDPKRVCIVGASYGGYAALAGVTLDPGVYRCAVAVSGVSDLRLMRKWTIAHHSSLSQRYWDRFMGTTDQHDPALIAISPIEHVNEVNVPVLLIHGKDDTVVPYEQSDVMLGALKRAGKPVDLVTLKHEDHWLSRSETRLQMLEASVAFLKANNPPN